MNYFWLGFGVSFGTVLGIVAGLVVYRMGEWWKQKEKVAILKREFSLNIKKIDGLLDELNKYRSKIAAEDEYFEYLDLSRFVWGTAQNMLYSGLIYKYLKDDEDIDKLQIMFSNLSLMMSRHINDKVINRSKGRDKKEAVKQLDFFEEQLKGYKKDLNRVLEKFPRDK